MKQQILPKKKETQATKSNQRTSKSKVKGKIKNQLQNPL